MDSRFNSGLRQQRFGGSNQCQLWVVHRDRRLAGHRASRRHQNTSRGRLRRALKRALAFGKGQISRAGIFQRADGADFSLSVPF
jgi:hypothetical protein